ncbi:MAG: IclR family transcriptional regulator [Eubacteriales bacterium]
MEKSKYSAPAVERALEILEIMVQNNKSFTATEMAGILGVSVNSVFRIFIELERRYYVLKDPSDSSYELTPKIYYLGTALKERVSIVTGARTYMKRLFRTTNETVVLTIMNEEYQTVVVDQLVSKQPVKFVSTVGFAYDTYNNAMGKAMLAYMSEDEIKEYLDKTQLKKITEHTITSKVQFGKELERVRQEGVGYDREESIPGLICIASPIFSAGGKVEGAIGTTGFVFTMNDEQLAKNVEQIKKQAADLSESLGYRKEIKED